MKFYLLNNLYGTIPCITDISWQVSVAEQAGFEPYLVKKWKQGYSDQHPYSKTCKMATLKKS